MSYCQTEAGLTAAARTLKAATARRMSANVSRNGIVNSTGMMTQSMERNEPGAFGVPGTSMAMMAAKRTTS